MRSVLVHGDRCCADGRRQERRPSKQARGASESPLVAILNTDAGRDDRCLPGRGLRRAGHSCRGGRTSRWIIVSAIDDDREARTGTAIESAAGYLELPRGRCRFRNEIGDWIDLAVIDLVGDEKVVDQPEGVSD